MSGGDVALVDRPWGANRVRGLIEGSFEREVAPGYWVEVESDGYFGLRSGADMRPELVLDCVQLDEAVGRIEDPVVRCAVRLTMLGERPEVVGSVLRDRRQRPGSVLVAEGVRRVLRFERARYEGRRES